MTEQQKYGTLGQTERIDGEITAESPIHSGGDEKTGNQTLLRRQTFLVRSMGERVEVPVIPGNSVKGHVRRLLVADMAERLDYAFTSEDIYYAAYSGGRLEKGSEGGVIDAGLRQRVRRNLPPVSLLGTALGNQMFSGVVEVKHMLPVCSELEERTGIESEYRVGELTDFEFHTRSDDNPDDTGVKIDFEVGESDEGDEDKGARQMKYEFEVFVPGTRFHHGFVLNSHASELDASCLAHAIQLWSDEATIGGMASSGYGEISLEYDTDRTGELYREHLEENQEDAVEVLEDLSDL